MKKSEIKKVLFITYFFTEKDGVGAQRSRSLYYFLKNKGVEVNVISKEKNPLILIYRLIYSLIFNSYDKVYVSCGPFNNLVFIGLLCFLSRKKLVIDFRDAWSLNIYSGYGKGEKNKNLKYYLSLCIEKIMYFFCTNFIVCTLGMYEKYKKIFNDERKLLLIENGYDFKAFEKKEINNPNDLSLVCIGKFAEYDYKKAKLTVQEIQKYCENRKVKLNFVGSNRHENEKLLKELNTDFTVNFYPRMAYDKAIEIARNCDIGILVIRDEEIDYGTKFFDYVGLGLPFFSYLEKEKFFFKNFNSFLYHFESNKSYFNQSDIKDYSRRRQFNKFKGILFS